MATLDDILQNQDGSKTNPTIGNVQGEGTNVQQNADAAPTPAVASAKGAESIPTISSVKDALPGAQVQSNVESKSQLAGQPKTPAEGEVMMRILTSMGYNAPETPEEKAKREKNEKWEKILSAVGDGVSAMAGLYFAGQTGVSNYSAEDSMSKKTKDRWDKLNKDREANAKAYGDAYLRLKGMRDQEQHWRDQVAQQQKEFDFRLQEAKRQQNNWQTTFNYNKEKDDKAWAQLLKDKKTAKEQWQKEFDLREQNIKFQNEQAKKNYNLQWTKMNGRSADDYFEVLLSDTEKIKVPKQNLDGNIDFLYNSLPDNLRSQVQGEPLMNNYGMQVMVNGQPQYKPLTNAQKWAVVQQFISDPQAEDARTALKTLAGQETKKKPSKPKLF